MAQDGESRLPETNTVKMLSVLKALAQCHVILGLIRLILSTLADCIIIRAFVPAIIIVSGFIVHFYQHECWGECDWHSLATSLPRNSHCQIMCGDHVDDNMRISMTHAGLISAAILELLLALVKTIISSRTIRCTVRGPSVEMVPLNGGTTSMSCGPFDNATIKTEVTTSCVS
ncbi:unnamed protein product [Haemonchus placei]|uniref:Glycoprotein n=1 Tax=Haemonchus placei TaxID=6290 RepID=A0A0N4X9N9_HAEPC|nr:unnamed protein product [Haemonchus placei]